MAMKSGRHFRLNASLDSPNILKIPDSRSSSMSPPPYRSMRRVNIPNRQNGLYATPRSGDRLSTYKPVGLLERLQYPAKIHLAPRVNYAMPTNRGESLKLHKSRFEIAPKIGQEEFKSLRLQKIERESFQQERFNRSVLK